MPFDATLPGLSLPGIAARKLGAGDAAILTTFCHRCREFFTLVADDAPADETAHLLLDSRPPGVEPARKHVIGLVRGGELIAVVDLLEGFPGEGDWYVGLLLLAPEERALGLGTAVWLGIEAWIRTAGGRRARLIVQQQNPAAGRFWRSVGFVASGEADQALATRTNRCWRYEKELTVSSS